LAREICQKLVERRLLGSAKAAEALEWLGAGIRPLAEIPEDRAALLRAGDLTLRLIEQGRARTPALALETLSGLAAQLKGLEGRLPADKADEALKAAVEMALKLLEVHFVSQSQLPSTLESLALAAAKVLPDR
jgi:hypothetical protein